MSCRISVEKIADHLARAGESRSGSLSRHIAECSECSTRVAHLQETSRLLDGAGMGQPPAGMWQKIEPRLSSRQAAPRGVWSRRAIIGVLATAILAALVILQVRPGSVPYADDVEAFYGQHEALKSAEAGGVVSDATVEELERQVAFDVRMPRNLPSGWRLVGVDRSVCRRGLPVAHLAFGKGDSVLSVFQKPAAKLGGGQGQGRGMGFGRRHGIGRGGGGMTGGGQMCRFRGQNVAMSSSGYHRFFVFGDLPAQDLRSIAGDLAAQEAK